jgi:ArsR family metal-binding transcriptional regulator
MALKGLQIYSLLPKTNCKKCGYPTCLAFAMALAQGKVRLISVRIFQMKEDKLFLRQHNRL